MVTLKGAIPFMTYKSSPKGGVNRLISIVINISTISHITSISKATWKELVPNRKKGSVSKAAKGIQNVAKAVTAKRSYPKRKKRS